MTGLPIQPAARELGVGTATLRRWMRDGAPVARRGGRGRGRAALIDPESIRAWQAQRKPQRGDADDLLHALMELAPNLAVDSALAAMSTHGPLTQGGAEHKRLNSAVRCVAQHVADAITSWAENRSSKDAF